MVRSLITREEFIQKYSLTLENFNHLCGEKLVIPVKFGLQTFVLRDYSNLMMENAILQAEMDAGLHSSRRR